MSLLFMTVKTMHLRIQLVSKLRGNGNLNYSWEGVPNGGKNIRNKRPTGAFDQESRWSKIALIKIIPCVIPLYLLTIVLSVKWYHKFIFS